LATSVSAACILAGYSAVQADAPTQQALGQHLSGECTGCHRMDGTDTGVPSITGWRADDFVTTMRYYKSGARHHPVMKSVAGSLDDEQLAAVAAYFATLPPQPKKK
jgi:cytochrome c553